MQDKLRYVLSVRTLIEMSLLRAARVATVASIEEVLRAVRELAARDGNAAPASVAQERDPPRSPSAGSAHPPSAPQPAAPKQQPPSSPAPGGSRSGATAAPQAAAPKPAPKAAELSADERQKILDDDKLNGLLKALPGAKITDLR